MWRYARHDVLYDALMQRYANDVRIQLSYLRIFHLFLEIFHLFDQIGSQFEPMLAQQCDITLSYVI